MTPTRRPATHYDAALCYLQLASDAVERARDCLRIGHERAEYRLAAVREAYEADEALKRILWAIVADMTDVRVAAIIHERLHSERVAAGEVAA